MRLWSIVSRRTHLLHTRYTSPQVCSSRFYDTTVTHQPPQTPTISVEQVENSEPKHAFQPPSLGANEGQDNGNITGLEPLPDFALLGVRKSVRAALHACFPNIHTPTACQTELIPAILQRKDVILRDKTGTGKTLGLVLALLSKERATRPRMTFKERASLSKRPITSLIIVPHRDLAYQLMQWIRMLCPHNLQSSLDSIGQVCVRGDKDVPIDVQISKLRQQAPHVLIGTPYALLEIMEKDKDALQIPTLDAVVVDEVDYLLPLPKPNAAKKWRNWHKHPPPTLAILNELFAMRSKKHRERNARPWRYPLQAVFSSATLERHLRLWLFNQTDWLDRHSQTERIDYHNMDSNPGIKHYALVVDDDGAVRNSEIARQDSEIPENTKLVNSPQVPKTSPYVLEAIATTFAVDVPRIALLILPATSPVITVVNELRELGINARSLGLQDQERGQGELMRSTLRKLNGGRGPTKTGVLVDEPDLLVTTFNSIRGLDFPELTHVFIAGVPGEEKDYAHAAGRVGRFGREGKVVLFFERREEKKAAVMYKNLNISLSEFEDIQV